MSTPMERAQRETDRQRGIYDRRQMDKARFGTGLGDELFALGADAMRTQAAFVPPPIKENDPKRLAQIADEVYLEGRQHRNTRPQRHE